MARPKGRELIDIEGLLRLAYGVHMVDRVTPAGILAMRKPSAGASPTAMIGAHVALGAAIDTSRAGATFLGKAHQMRVVEDDFLDVHEAVLSLPRMWADIPGGQAAEFVVWDEPGLHDARRLGFDVDATLAPDGSIRSARIAPLRHDGAAPAGPRVYRNGVVLAAQVPAEGEGEHGAEAEGDHGAAKKDEKNEGGGHGAAKEGEGEADPALGKIAEGPDGITFYTLPDMVVNIQSADGKPTFLKLSLTLEMHDADLAHTLQGQMPRMQDMFQGFLRELRPEDLAGSAGSYQLRAEILRRVNLIAAPSKVDAVLIEEMLVQ